MNEQDIIKTLINRRKQLELSQQELAEITGIKQPAIARMESFNSTPNLKTLIIIADALGLKIELRHKNVLEEY